MPLTRKKLLILVDWFVPGYKAGGPIQSCVNICSAFNTDYDIYVLTTDTDHGETAPYPGIIPGQWLYNGALNVHVCYLKKQTISSKQIAAQIAFVNADIVYLNHLFSPLFVVYPLWLLYRHQLNGRVVVCPRGALYQSALSLKSYKKKPLLLLYKLLGIHKMVTFHATNQREKEAIEKHFPGSSIVVADNLPKAQQAPFKSLEKKPGELRCIFIARIVPIKNLAYLLQVLNAIRQKIYLTIIGPVENETYWNDCRRLVAELPKNIYVEYAGPKANNELAGLIQQHHLFISPTTGENFGHAIFEALLAGRPVLISDQTPWLNLQKENAGWDVSLNDPGGFESVLSSMADCSQQQFDAYADGARAFATKFISNNKSKQPYHILF
ncbi:MAG: glycosyltransferase family 4 protein [Chitinophagaceae bacterium]|nr:glycosyltransferase family 4 protein [Chitinophagaceae bacterium]